MATPPRYHWPGRVSIVTSSSTEPPVQNVVGPAAIMVGVPGTSTVTSFGLDVALHPFSVTATVKWALPFTEYVAMRSLVTSRV